MVWFFWPRGLWDLNFPTEMEPVVPPALEGQFLTTGLPGKSLYLILKKKKNKKQGKTANLGMGGYGTRGMLTGNKYH